MYQVKDFLDCPGYALENDTVSMHVSMQAGQMVPVFHYGGKNMNPFFVAPWYNEYHGDQSHLLRKLRGMFFCLPFGGNDQEKDGVQYDLHGPTCNMCWDKKEVIADGDREELVLTCEFDAQKDKRGYSPVEGGGIVEKHLSIQKGEPVVYVEDRNEGIEGVFSAGYHPTLKLPEQEGRAILDVPVFDKAFTPPLPVENPAAGGYSLLQTGQVLDSLEAIKTIFNDTVDGYRHPMPRGFEDVIFIMADQKRDFAYVAVTFPDDGYVYFQLKDPKVLPATMLWTSNQGRYYVPWNGRNYAVIGLEETCSFFHYGVKESTEENWLTGLGYPTCMTIAKDKSKSFRMIVGAVPVGDHYQGVADIVRKDASTIVIRGRDGSEIEVPCRADFLKTSE